MSDLFSSATSYEDNKQSSINSDLEDFLMVEKQKAQFNAQVSCERKF